MVQFNLDLDVVELIIIDYFVFVFSRRTDSHLSAYECMTSCISYGNCTYVILIYISSFWMDLYCYIYTVTAGSAGEKREGEICIYIYIYNSGLAFYLQHQ